MYSKDFLGSGLQFPLRIDPKTGKLAMSSHEENIRQSVGIILRTYHGERVMRPEFGTSTLDYAFAPSNYSLTEAISYELSRQLVVQEPRIRDIQVECQEPESHSGALIVHVAYTIRSTNNRYNHVYPFYLEKQEDESL